MLNCFLSVKAIAFLLLFSMLIISGEALTQDAGCTDPHALNYDPGAIYNDGSCIYEETSFTPEQYLEFPSSLDETSGLIFWAGGVWTFNDSGGDPSIYKVDTLNGEILQTISLANAENVDWEDITQDDEYIYVGDIGNNAGSRTDLTIYRVAKTSIPAQGNASVSSQIIEYSYADQISFEPGFGDHDYDCEAMISFGDQLYLFTKNWKSETTRLYAIEKEPGQYSVLSLDTLNVDGLVTGAGYSEEHGEIILSGYKDYKPFLFLLFDFQEDAFFSGHKRRIDMGGIFGAQTEGICYTHSRNVLLSCEKSAFDQQLFRLSTSPWTDTTAFGLAEYNDITGIKISPNPAIENSIEIFIPRIGLNDCIISIYDSSGREQYRKEFGLSNTSGNTMIIPVQDLGSGMYFVRILSGNKQSRKKLIIP